ncbi:hypothetical protein HAX54_004476 [Datura stramonium]|uniref:Uncharacterized protein n=1 Tax=Datura stramonium TaxID=4076 RepID=A0ABS8T714_DATST|nr:hypothetical protein [Datura stramonium]
MVGYRAWSSAEARHLSVVKEALNSEVQRTYAWHLAGMRASYGMTRQAGGMGKGAEGCPYARTCVDQSCVWHRYCALDSVSWFLVADMCQVVREVELCCVVRLPGSGERKKK